MYKISVIILIDKMNEHKIEMLDSLKNQTLKDIEILCVANEIKEIEKYRDIKIVKDFNEALSDIKGEYTTITSANTFFEEKWTEKMYDYAKIDNKDVVVCNLNIEDYEKRNLEKYNLENIENDINKIVILNWNLCNLLFKTEKIKNIKLKHNNKYNELLFILEALTRCTNIGYAQNIKSYIYMKEKQLHNIEMKDIQELKDILKEAKEIYKSENKYNEQYKEILSAIAFILLGVNTIIKLSKKQELNIDIKEEMRGIINYLDINFFEWRNNSILRSSFIKRELPYIWYANKMYRYGYIELYIKLYNILDTRN